MFPVLLDFMVVEVVLSVIICFASLLAATIAAWRLGRFLPVVATCCIGEDEDNIGSVIVVLVTGNGSTSSLIGVFLLWFLSDRTRALSRFLDDIGV